MDPALDRRILRQMATVSSLLAQNRILVSARTISLCTATSESPHKRNNSSMRGDERRYSFKIPVGGGKGLNLRRRGQS